MNQLIPTYSFIKLFLPRAVKYNSDIYINYHTKKYAESFTINKIDINMDLIFREDYLYNPTNSYFIKTHIQLKLQDKNIDETILIKNSNDYIKINYDLKNNDEQVEKIDLPKFKIENNNYKLLLNNYKFLDKIYNNEDYYKLFLGIQKTI